MRRYVRKETSHHFRSSKFFFASSALVVVVNFNYGYRQGRKTKEEKKETALTRTTHGLVVQKTDHCQKLEWLLTISRTEAGGARIQF